MKAQLDAVPFLEMRLSALEGGNPASSGTTGIAASGGHGEGSGETAAALKSLESRVSNIEAGTSSGASGGGSVDSEVLIRLGELETYIAGNKTKIKKVEEDSAKHAELIDLQAATTKELQRTRDEMDSVLKNQSGCLTLTLTITLS